MRKLVKNKKCVSEVVGVILMLGMAIALFAFVYIIAINFPFNEPNPSVRLSATIDDYTIVIVHQGGESLSPKTNIIVVIDGYLENKTVANLPGYKGSSWNIGEKLLFNHSKYSTDNALDGKEVKITVVDIVSNTVVMQGTVRGDDQT